MTVTYSDLFLHCAVGYALCHRLSLLQSDGIGCENSRLPDVGMNMYDCRLQIVNFAQVEERVGELAVVSNAVYSLVVFLVTMQ